MKTIDDINNALTVLESRLGGFRPLVGIILGSGLGKLADLIEEPLVIPYSDIPGMPRSTAIGHKGNFIAGRLSGKNVIAMQGRIHFYEGYPMEDVVLPVRLLLRLGIGFLFVSNAAGGTDPSYKVGDLMVITDHINMQPNPLIGPNIDELGPRFPDMTRPYDTALVQKAFEIAEDKAVVLRHGVYVALTGPSYETPAEYRYLRGIGADAVGMSTTPEVIVARHAGVRVFGMSVITDVAHATEEEDYVVDGNAVVEAANAAADRMSLIFAGLIGTL